MIERRVGLFLALLPILGGCASMNQFARSQMGREFVAMPFAADGDSLVWVVGHEQEIEDTQLLVEMVRPPETVEDWTELVTVQTFNKRAVDWGDLDAFLTLHRDEVEKRCPGSSLEIRARDSKSLLYEHRIVNCAQGAPETSMGRVLDGDDNRFMLQYAVRSPLELDEARRTEWTAKLQDVRIVRMR